MLKYCLWFDIFPEMTLKTLRCKVSICVGWRFITDIMLFLYFVVVHNASITQFNPSIVVQNLLKATWVLE